jgi:hypothetical protein
MNAIPMRLATPIQPLWMALVLAIAFGFIIGTGGCASPPEAPTTLLAPTDEQMKLRNIQTRQFDVSDRRVAMRAVMAALQDLGFIMERANEPLGVVTAARFAEPNYYDVVGITVTVRLLNPTRATIRANAIYNNEPITDPQVYRNFFATLERSLFIGRN